MIDEAVEYFLEKMSAVCERNSFRKARKMPATFSMLKPANDEYYEYVYFEKILEWSTRDSLINPILKGLFQIHGIETVWSDVSKRIRYSTESIENIYPFEFIFLLNKEKLGSGILVCAPEIQKS